MYPAISQPSVTSFSIVTDCGWAEAEIASNCEAKSPEQQARATGFMNGPSERSSSSDSTCGARIGSATDGDESLLIVDNFDIDNGGRFSRASDARHGGERPADRRSQIVGAEIHGGHAAADQHADG